MTTQSIVLLSAGHYPGARGACWPAAGPGRVCEHELARSWLGVVTLLVREQLPVVEVPTGPLEEKVAWMNAYRAPEGHRVALAAELHFNSNEQRRGSGAETLYYPGSKRGRAAAEAIQRELAAVYRDRGVHEGWYRADRPGRVDYPGDVEGDEKALAFMQGVPFPAVIVEPEFIFNQAVLEATRNEACAAIARGVLAFCHATN